MKAKKHLSSFRSSTFQPFFDRIPEKLEEKIAREEKKF
jgi:hypothetical protein